jgi:hypothetical protein
VGDVFTLGFKGEDKWGNPSHRVQGRFTLEASRPVAGLPEAIDVSGGTRATTLRGLRVDEPGELAITVKDAEGRVVCTSNPLRIVTALELLPYWADLHGQSEETIGTNSARELIEFARDQAFLDAMSHQGNDFQITTPFWEELNRLTAEFNKDGEFIIFPGYEWSGNTGLGGDRNVMFRQEGRQIRRSHHALVEDLSDVQTDANSADDLFKSLEFEDCVVFAHIGGRYADIKAAHDGLIERSVEVHSDWGTFEWLLEDAFEQGFRVGVLANSDGHKGRHGASHPGASLFGAYGGLSCLLATDLSRDALFEALRRRHHYATTGTRVHLDVRARFDRPVSLYGDDPNMGGKVVRQVREAMMGDIVQTGDDAVTLAVDVSAGAPIERIEIRNRTEVLETWRPYDENRLGRRLRIIWEGSEYRGRGRQSVWDGTATLEANAFESFRPINLWNIDKPLRQPAPGQLAWSALTTGGFGGADVMLESAEAGSLRIDTKLAQADLKVADIGLQDTVLDTSGGIKRRMRLFRMPDFNDTRSARIERRIALNPCAEDALYVCVTLEDGHRVWSSPIYLLP